MRKGGLMKILIVIGLNAAVLIHLFIKELGDYAEDVNPHNKNRDV